MKITRIFISNTFTRNTKLKFAKNQENPKQHHEAKLLLFENYLYSSVVLSKKQESLCFNEAI